MAAPTQEYPPWLTAVPTTIYAPNGEPLTTATEILYLPLTYYGPSIPLGPEWTYGGLTSPASTSSVMSTTSTSITMPTTTSIPTAIPTTSSSTASPSSTSAATSTSSLPSSSLSSTSSPTSTSPSPTSTSAVPTPSAASGLSRAQLIGVIIASILGFIFLFIVGLLLLLCIRRRRRSSRGSPYGTLRDESFTWVTPDGRMYGEGSPRTSGEERDAFLQRSRSSGYNSELGGRPPYAGIPRVPVPHDSHSSGSTSGYGDVLEKPTLNLRPATPEFDYSNARGKILSEEDIRKIEEEATLPDKEKDEDDPLLLPPPRLVDPARRETFQTTRRESSQTTLGQYPDADEPATILNARRVRVDELGIHSPPKLPHPVDGSGSSKSTNRFLNSLGLNRLSKLMNFGSTSGHRSWGPEEGEAGQSLLGRREMAEMPEAGPSSYKRPILGLGLIEGERPQSGYSSKSNGTVYYDARSSFRATPTLMNTPPTPLPRVLTPNLPVWGSASSRGSPAPHIPPVPPLPSTVVDQTQTRDVLDEPAPAAVSPFSGSASVPSLRDTATAVTASDRTYYPFPPGLEHDGARAKSWASSTSPHSRNQSFHPVSSLGTNAGISIDILEEEPPRAGANWRAMSDISQHERRGTFGQRIANASEFAEIGSLYSERSQLDPNANNGSRRDLNGSQGSASSNGRSVGTVNTEGSQGSGGPWLMAPPPAHIFGRPFSAEWTGGESPESASPPTSPRNNDWTLGL